MKISLSRKDRKNLIRIIVSLAMFLAIFIADKIVVLGNVFDSPAAWVFPFALYLTVYLIIGYDVLWKAVRNIAHGQVFDENFLMCVATLGAFALAIYRGVSGQKIEGFDEACAVLLFYQVGEWFQSYATGRSRKSIASLMDIRPDYANIVRDDGSVDTVEPSEVAIGDVILINPGEKVPLDGVVVNGQSTLDTKALTGESLPREISEGAEIISGAVNLTSQLKVKVEKQFYDSTVSKILELVESAASQKSRVENFITKFARYYTPAVCVIALLLAIIPGASFFAGIGAASRYGILIKGSNYLEQFNKANTFVFDKTGTLTKGNFAVTRVYPEEDAEKVLALAAIAEHDSNHPIAVSIVARYGKETETGYTLTNVAGSGVMARKGSRTILCGNEKLMRDNGIDYVKADEIGTVVYVAADGAFIGYIIISDEAKPESAQVIGQLNGMECRTIMLTGDNPEIAAKVAGELGLTDYKASLLPQDKVAETERLLAQKKPGEVLCFVGDGINDAPVLMRADIGIAMGGVGSDAAIEASDIVLMQDDLKGISLAKKIAKKTMAIVMQNIVFSIAVKVAILILSALGIANMWIAVFGDVGVAVLAILNAMRVNSKYSK